MLERISLRTIPESRSAFAILLPLLLLPSPGYGPAVSSGMTEQEALPVLLVLPVLVLLPEVVPVVELVLVPVLVAVLLPELLELPPQAAREIAAAPLAVSQRNIVLRSVVVSSKVFRSCSRE